LNLSWLRAAGFRARVPNSTSTLASCPSGSEAEPATVIQSPLTEALLIVTLGGIFGGGDPIVIYYSDSTGLHPIDASGFCASQCKKRELSPQFRP
jgi:hypothetical protein